MQKNHDISQKFDFFTIYSDISPIYRDGIAVNVLIIELLIGESL